MSHSQLSRCLGARTDKPACDLQGDLCSYPRGREEQCFQNEESFLHLHPCTRSGPPNESPARSAGVAGAALSTSGLSPPQNLSLDAETNRGALHLKDSPVSESRRMASEPKERAGDNLNCTCSQQWISTSCQSCLRQAIIYPPV